jgi:hypothetical protein
MSCRAATPIAASAPSVRRTAMSLAGAVLIAVVLAAALTARADAQVPSESALQIRPLVGAVVGMGDQREVFKNAVLVGAQASYTLAPHLALIGSFSWSPSEDRTSATRPAVDLYQLDLGVEAQSGNLTPTAPIATRPYVTLGGGVRTYDHRNLSGGAQANALGYVALGLDLKQTDARVGLRLEVRDNVTAFKGMRGELRDRTARFDLQFAAGLSFGL